MVDIKGDATQSEIDDQIKVELAARIASSTETNPVKLSTAEATRILDLLGGPPKAAAGPGALGAETEEEESPAPSRRRR